jgi:hypothetical protein
VRNETYLKVITLLLFTVSPLFAQENTLLKGTVFAPFLEEASIHIINSTQKTGTLNSDSGSFQILVRENDELLFSSIQYKNVTIRISSEIIEKRTLSIFLEEDLNVLDEVNISNVALSGNLNADIAQIPIVRNMPVNLNFGDIKNMRFEADINDPTEAPRNLAFENNTIIKPGVNLLGLAGIFAGLLGIKEKAAIRAYKSRTLTTNEQLRKLFQDDFFTETLQVEKDYIDDFIYYVDDNGLRNILGKPDNQLALIEFLMEQSKIYNDIKFD